MCSNLKNNKGHCPVLNTQYYRNALKIILVRISHLLIVIPDKTELAKDLPGVSFIRDYQSLLVVITKTLAAHHLAKLDSFDQLCTDGTDRRQTEFENVVVGYMADNGYKSVILDATIVPDGKTAEHLNNAIIRTYCESQCLL